MELAGIVPLPTAVADNNAAAFLPLAGEAPLVRIVAAMLGAVAEPNRVVVAAAEPLIPDVETGLAASGLASVSIVAVAHPATRSDCVAAALEWLDRQPVPASHVLVHDIAQPVLSADLRDRVIAALRGGSAVVMPALPVTDSVKAVDDRGSVIGTLDRSLLRAVQHPRGFAVDDLARVLSRRASENFDELREAMSTGASITVVEGDPDAIHAELPRDAQFVEAIIESRRQDPHGR